MENRLFLCVRDIEEPVGERGDSHGDTGLGSLSGRAGDFLGHRKLCPVT